MKNAIQEFSKSFKNCKTIEIEVEKINFDPIEEVLSEKELNRIKKYRKPKQCHKNSFMTLLDIPNVIYCEGYIRGCIPHAFCYHIPSGKYFDPTLNNTDIEASLVKKYTKSEVSDIFLKEGACFIIFNDWKYQSKIFS